MKRTNEDFVLRSELIISQLLKWGVYVCGAIMLIGCVLSFASPSAWELDQAVIVKLRTGQTIASPLFYHSASDLFSGILQLEPNAWLVLGLATLILLPILRVAMTVGIFIIQKDKTFTLLSSFVLAMLLLSAFLGHAE